MVLSGEVISEEYSLEYGTDKMEMHVGAVEAGEHALVIDDLIATGGTLCAAVKLLGSVS
jgi:adenine phosphoribosyltransferase